MRTGVVRGMFSQPRLDGKVVLGGGDIHVFSLLLS